MAKKTKLMMSGLALIIALFIFGVSLIMASQIRSENSLRVSERKFYVGKTILPDHVLYPILMVADRIILQSSFGNRKIYVQMRLADDRLYSSKVLINNDQEELALSTMTKAQKYLINAAQEFLNSDNQQESVKKDLLRSLENNSRELKKCKDNFERVDTSPIESLLVELDALIIKLNN
ncbi:MAG: hypothetical protein H6772_03085 [Pseudomonadales bacterium]|nr:hypothetical protein [Pseudomonadales bacterium]